MVSMYDNEAAKFVNHHEKLDQLYERELSSLIDKKEDDKLPATTRITVSNEFDNLLRLVDMGIQEKDGQEFEFVVNDQYFDKLRTDVRNTCPILFDLFRTLFPADPSPDAKRKELCLVNSLCLLVSLKNKTVKNDAKLLFSILLISFGVGWRLMNTICRIGLTLH